MHGVILGGVDTDMSRDYDGPKVSPESAAAGIFDGLEKGEEDIFSDPTSRPIADGWRSGVVKALERRINAVVLEGAQTYKKPCDKNSNHESIFVFASTICEWNDHSNNRSAVSGRYVWHTWFAL